METAIAQNPATDLIETDLDSVWHPFTQAKTAQKPLACKSAKGAYIFMQDGERYFDAISSWWVTTHGHCHPYIAKAIAHQTHTLDQAVFADFTHEPGAVLAKRLLDRLEMSKGKVFFSDNGSTAVETALKISIQYWHNKHAKDSRQGKRSKILCFEQGYHGDTFGAMSVSGKTPFNLPFHPYLFQVETLPAPTRGNEEQAIRMLKALIARNDAAAFIFEPVVQGAAGMRVHSAEALERMIALCNEQGIITIADEVMTGFGRTGPLFACGPMKAKPAITCLSKGITGGFLPLGATVCEQWIYDCFLDDSLQRAFLHGHTYCGNPLACAAALASLDLYENPQCDLARREIERLHQLFQREWGSHPALLRCDVAGTILALEYREERNNPRSVGYFSKLRSYLFSHFLSQQIYIRPIGNVLYLIPPYCSSQSDLEATYQCIQSTLEEL